MLRDGDIVIAFFAGERRTGIIVKSQDILYVLFPQYGLGCLVDNVIKRIGNIDNDLSLLDLLK